MGNEPKTEYPQKKKALSNGPTVNLRPLFNSNMTKVFVIKWSQNCRTIRTGVVTALHKWGGAHQTSNQLPKPNI